MKHLIVVFATLMVALPGLSAAPPPTPILECTVQHLDTSIPGEISGEYLKDDWSISFVATVKDGMIYSNTTFRNTLDDKYGFDVEFSFQYTAERQIPDMTKLVIRAAFLLTEQTDCDFPDNINEMYEEFADALYRCTMDMGASQLRFSIMYHETIVASARRICNGAESICTPSAKYEYGDGEFICSEDLEELFPEKALEAKIKMKEESENRVQQYKDLMSRGKRWLQGSQWCCCGNYEGFCWYANIFCCIHDAVCTNCAYWHCGPDCQPDLQ